jgi:hypothetical protein
VTAERLEAALPADRRGEAAVEFQKWRLTAVRRRPCPDAETARPLRFGRSA